MGHAGGTGGGQHRRLPAGRTDCSPVRLAVGFVTGRSFLVPAQGQNAHFSFHPSGSHQRNRCHHSSWRKVFYPRRALKIQQWHRVARDPSALQPPGELPDVIPVTSSAAGGELSFCWESHSSPAGLGEHPRFPRRHGTGRSPTHPHTSSCFSLKIFEHRILH